LIGLGLIALMSSASVVVGTAHEQREAEDTLLAIGREYRIALASYATIGGAKGLSQPARLEDLLKDPRFAQPVRHLRRIYVDPMTGQTEWGVVRTLDGQGILGIYSISMRSPVKLAQFEQIFVHFSEAKSYRDWVFSPTPPQALLEFGKRGSAFTFSSDTSAVTGERP